MKQYVNESAEIIDGYEVCEKQKKIWNAELDLLEKFLDFCNQNDLTIFPLFGTMLGIVRHGGMIPWDDDIDVCMFREDYEKACQLAPKYFKEPYFFQTSFTDPANFTEYARLRNSNTTAYITTARKQPFNQGIFLDIFVLDKEPDSNFKRFFFEKSLKYKHFLCCNYRDFVYDSKIARLFKPILFIHKKLFSFESTCKSYYKKMQKYNKTNSNTIDCVRDRLDGPYKTEWFQKFETRDFYGMKLLMPIEYDPILKSDYGDYMQRPDISKLGKWHDGVIEFEPSMPYQEYIKNKK